MTARFLILVAMLISYILYQSKMFQSIESIRDLYRKDNSQSMGAISLKFTLIVLAVFASMKLPQEIDKILMISGSLFGTILLFLFPILIFNKTQKGYGNCCFRFINWALFGTAIVIGGAGFHYGLK